MTKTPFRNTSDLFKTKPSLVWQLKDRKGGSSFYQNLIQQQKEDAKALKQNEKKVDTGLSRTKKTPTRAKRYPRDFK